MKVYTLDIDSSERDPILYPGQNSYVIELKNPVYDIKKIKLLSAKIPYTQLLINNTNNTFSINNYNFTLSERNYSNGYEIASELQTNLDIQTSNISSVTFEEETNSLLFSNIGTSNIFSLDFYSGTNGYLSEIENITTPHQILGFTSLDYTSKNGEIRSGSINLEGPNDIILRISSGSDDFNKSIYSNTPFYTGRILKNGNITTYNGADDPIEHLFHSGQHKVLSHLKFEFFYMSHGRLIPYDFRNQDHILKLELECSLDKLEGLPKVQKTFDLPPPISIPEFENPYKWKEYIYISVIVVVGTLLMMLLRPKRLSE
jgi:hypothetical protein